jgi:hypothetical protein
MEELWGRGREGKRRVNRILSPPFNQHPLKRLHESGMQGSHRSFTRGRKMRDVPTLWSILVLYLLAAGLIGGLLPTWPLSMAATATFALAFLLLVLVNVPEISLDLAQLVIAIALFAGALGHLVRRVVGAWWRVFGATRGNTLAAPPQSASPQPRLTSKIQTETLPRSHRP